MACPSNPVKAVRSHWFFESLALSNCFGILSPITSTYFMPSNFALAEAAAYIVCCVLVELGYFIGLKKSILVPCLIVPSLGFLSWDFDVVSTKMLVAPPFYPKFIWTSVLLMPDCSLCNQYRSKSLTTKQVSYLHRELESFLASLSSPKSLLLATPDDLICFLIWRD